MRGNLWEISLTFSILSLITLLSNSSDPTGDPNKTIPESSTKGIPLPKGSELRGAALAARGYQTVDLGLFDVADVERCSSLAGPCFIRISTTS